MTQADRVEARRLVLQIERDTTEETHLRALTTIAQATVAGHRRDLRALKTPRTRTTPKLRSRRHPGSG